MMTDDATRLPVPTDARPRHVSTVAELADIPEEEIWLSKQKSARTRRAYRLDVQHFMRTVILTAMAAWGKNRFRGCGRSYHFIKRGRCAEEAVSRFIQAEHPGRLILGSHGRQAAADNLRLLPQRWHGPLRGKVLSEFR
jgi:hypothetical protein